MRGGLLRVLLLCVAAVSVVTQWTKCLTWRWDGSGETNGCSDPYAPGLQNVTYANIVPVYPVTKWPQGHVATTGGASPMPAAGEYIDPVEQWWDLKAGLLNYTAASDYVSSIAFYAYGYPYAYSANSGRERSDTVSMFTVMDANLQWSVLYIIDKPFDGSGGSLMTNVRSTGAAVHDDWETTLNSGGQLLSTPLEVMFYDDLWDRSANWLNSTNSIASSHFTWNASHGAGEMYSLELARVLHRRHDPRLPATELLVLDHL